MELLANDETGILEFVAYEVVDFDEVTGYPIEESYVVHVNRPAKPGSVEHQEEILPYICAFVDFFASPFVDIPF